LFIDNFVFSIGNEYEQEREHKKLELEQKRYEALLKTIAGTPRL
jgi:hypothetical protein